LVEGDVVRLTKKNSNDNMRNILAGMMSGIIITGVSFWGMFGINVPTRDEVQMTMIKTLQAYSTKEDMRDYVSSNSPYALDKGNLLKAIQNNSEAIMNNAESVKMFALQVTKQITAIETKVDLLLDKRLK
jgi:hypothetical protein